MDAPGIDDTLGGEGEGFRTQVFSCVVGEFCIEEELLFQGCIIAPHFDSHRDTIRRDSDLIEVCSQQFSHGRDPSRDRSCLLRLCSFSR